MALLLPSMQVWVSWSHCFFRYGHTSIEVHIRMQPCILAMQPCSSRVAASLHSWFSCLHILRFQATMPKKKSKKTFVEDKPNSDKENSSSSETETQEINLSLRRRSRHRQLTQSFSYSALPIHIAEAGDTQSVAGNPSSARDITLNASQLIDDSSEIDTDFYISNDSSSDGTSNKIITFPGRSLKKTDFIVEKTIRKRKTQSKLIKYNTM